jgi:hypothetical protein
MDLNYFLKGNLMNRVHRSHGPSGGQRSMVHGGSWTEARQELAGAVAAHSSPWLHQNEEVSTVFTEVFGDWLDGKVRPAEKRRK